MSDSIDVATVKRASMPMNQILAERLLAKNIQPSRAIGSFTATVLFSSIIQRQRHLYRLRKS